MWPKNWGYWAKKAQQKILREHQTGAMAGKAVTVLTTVSPPGTPLSENQRAKAE